MESKFRDTWQKCDRVFVILWPLFSLLLPHSRAVPGPDNCQLTPFGCLMELSSVRFNARTLAADHNPRAAASHYCTPYPSLSSFPSVCTPYGCVPLHQFPLTDCHSHSGNPGAHIPACSILIALLLIYPLKVPAVLPFSFPSHL